MKEPHKCQDALRISLPLPQKPHRWNLFGLLCLVSDGKLISYHVGVSLNSKWFCLRNFVSVDFNGTLNFIHY